MATRVYRLQSLQQDLVSVNTDLDFSFSQQIEPFFRQLVELLLHDVDSLDDHEKQIRLEESRIAIEDLQQKELENFFPLACLDVRQQSIAEIDPYAAAIYPIAFSNSLEVILSVRDRPLQHYRTELNEDSQQEIFQEVCQYLNPVCKSSDILPSVQKLYDWLILPAENVLQENEITTLVFILDGFLRSLPMAVLHDGNQYLIEKYNIALTPGLQLIPPKTSNKSQLSLLTGGLTQARQGFPSLPGVIREIEQISQMIPANVLLDEDFTNNTVREQLDKNSFSIVHLASHGQFSSHEEDTFVLTWDDRLTVNNISKLLEKRNAKEAIKLLVLTACKTVPGDTRASLGLTGIAVCSGSRSTVATLWSVSDRSTASLITEFYRLLTQHNIPQAEALRKAQILLLQDPQYQHPYYWSSFVLVGNWK